MIFLHNLILKNITCCFALFGCPFIKTLFNRLENVRTLLLFKPMYSNHLKVNKVFFSFSKRFYNSKGEQSEKFHLLPLLLQSTTNQIFNHHQEKRSYKQRSTCVILFTISTPLTSKSVITKKPPFKLRHLNYGFQLSKSNVEQLKKKLDAEIF